MMIKSIVNNSFEEEDKHMKKVVVDEINKDTEEESKKINMKKPEHSTMSLMRKKQKSNY